MIPTAEWWRTALLAPCLPGIWSLSPYMAHLSVALNYAKDYSFWVSHKGTETFMGLMITSASVCLKANKGLERESRDLGYSLACQVLGWPSATSDTLSALGCGPGDFSTARPDSTMLWA